MTWEPDYVTTTEFKTWASITDTDDDAAVLIPGFITTASRAVDAFCHRQFGQVAAEENRQYNAVYDRHLGAYVTEIDDLMDVDNLVVVDETATELTDYDLEPLNALVKGKPYERIVTSVGGRLTISGLWGWASVPAPVKNATLLQAHRLYKRRVSPFGIAGSPADGSEMRLLATLDPDVKVSLGSKYRREVWVA